MSETADGVKQQLDQQSMTVGNIVRGSDKLPNTVSVPMYVDSGSKLAAGGFPFAVPMIAGATDTSASASSIRGSSTGSANELMHQTLVIGANATAVIAGYKRITVTDDAGNIANGAYYEPFYTLG